MSNPNDQAHSDAPTLENIIKTLVAAAVAVVSIAGGMYCFYKLVVFIQT